MFIHQQNDNPYYDNDLLNRKINLKVTRHYTNLGKIPGVLLEENKRRKLLQQLQPGIQFNAQSNLNEEQKGEQEEGADIPTNPQVQKALSSINSSKLQQNQLIPDRYKAQGQQSTALSLVNALSNNQNAITLRQKKIVHPKWHAPWKLYRVISGHQGWVRCLTMDPMNQFFVSGSNDRTIKFWDLVEGKLKITLTGHINTVRGLTMSSRHPYLFSCGEDKKILCWDLEQNKVVRHYHGHLSGVYTIAMHPQLDVLVTGGRDATARVWDMRTCAQVHVLGGHQHTVEDVACQTDEPQIITASHDKTIKLWDIRTGSATKTLTHHKKGIRSIAIHHDEYTFASGGSDKIRIWKFPDGDQLRTIDDHNAVINSIALNRDNVLVSGADNGSLYFFDWASGYNFQQIKTTVQPGSLSCEAGIYKVMFDKSSLRMITAECDKTIKLWKEDEEATPETHPILFNPQDK